MFLKGTVIYLDSQVVEYKSKVLYLQLGKKLSHNLR